MNLSIARRRESESPAAARLARFCLAYLVAPALTGWFLYVALESASGLVPQTIRLSAEGDYNPYMDDFVVFYTAGDMARTGDATDVYDPAAIHAREAQAIGVTPESIITLPYYNLPALLPLLGLLAALPIGAAAAVWMAVELGAFALALGAFRRLRALAGGGILPVIVLLAIGSSMPFHESLLHGQMSLLLVLAWVAIWFGAFKGKGDGWTVAGLTLLAVKPQLAVVPLGYLLVTRRWRPLALFAGIEALLGVAGVVLYGPGIFASWLSLLQAATGWENENGIWIHSMFGWNAFSRALLGTGLHDVRLALTAALGVLTAGAVLFWGRKALRERRDASLFAMLVFASILLSPHLFSQDLILVVPPLLLLMSSGSSAERAGWTVYALAGWLLTFVHFDLLLTSPAGAAINWVTVWLAGGIFLAGPGMRQAIQFANDLWSFTPTTWRQSPE
jgi:hypothetical protein